VTSFQPESNATDEVNDTPTGKLVPALLVVSLVRDIRASRKSGQEMI